MQHLSTAFLIYALAIVVNQVGATAHFYTYEEKTDQLATEAKNRAVTIIDGPKYVAPPSTPAPPTPANNTQPDNRPPSKPPINPTPDKHGKPKYVELPRIYIGQIQNLPPHLRNTYPKHVKVHSNSVYKYQKVIPLPPNRNTQYPKHQQLVFAASTNKPSVAAKNPKFSLPIETINGIRADFVRPPHFINTTTTTTTTTTVPTTTTKYLRTKRIWPKHILEKQKASNTTTNSTVTSATAIKINKNNTENDLSSSASQHRIKIILSDNVHDASSASPSTRPPYRRVTRVPKKKPTTPAPSDFSTFEPNDWVPIVPSHYPVKKVRKQQTHIRSRRSDRSEVYQSINQNESPAQSRRTMFLQSFGLVPVESSQSPTAASSARKSIKYVGKTKHLKPHVYSGYRGKPVVHTTQINGDYQTDESDPMKIITRIKHHHHHHHHRYVKTVEKPVRVEVPKPVPVPVPMPVPVKVEHKVPYPVQVKVPHPVPVKVIEKQYVPKPYPVMQQVQVPVEKIVEVKVPHQVPVYVEKKVPYPVQVEVPVPKPYPVAVPVEKRVPYPVPVRILVPQPYPVEKKVPVHVKEPVEVIKHVPVRVPVPKPYPVRVPHPVPVPYEKKVPYPVEVEKHVKVPVPYKVLVPEKVEVEKKVPVYVPRPYPVEKKVAVPVKVPYPVRVPIRVPVGVPILVHPSPSNDEHVVASGETVASEQNNQNQNNQNQQQQNQQYSHFAYAVMGNTVTSTPQNTISVYPNSGADHLNNINSIINTITDNPQQSVSVHGTPSFQNQVPQGFQSRSDVVQELTTPFSQSTSPGASSSENTLQIFESSSDVTTVNSNSTPDPR